jgi:hypothetical protein
MSFSYNNNWGGGYMPYNAYSQFNNGYTQPQMQAFPQQQFQTNKIFVTSLEEALARPAEPNTEIIYLHQTEPLLFQISTDLQRKKTALTFRLVAEEDKKNEPVDCVSRAEFEEYKKKVDEFLKGATENE